MWRVIFRRASLQRTVTFIRRSGGEEGEKREGRGRGGGGEEERGRSKLIGGQRKDKRYPLHHRAQVTSCNHRGSFPSRSAPCQVPVYSPARAVPPSNRALAVANLGCALALGTLDTPL